MLTVAEVSRLLWRDAPGTLPQDPVEMRNRVLLGVSYVAGLRASGSSVCCRLRHTQQSG